MEGIEGKVYIPETEPCELKKHPCKDCFSCQRCSDDRCRLCRGVPLDVIADGSKKK